MFLEDATPGFDLFDITFFGIIIFVLGRLPSESFCINNSRVFSLRQKELFIGKASDYCGCHPSDVTETNQLPWQMFQVLRRLERSVSKKH